MRSWWAQDEDIVDLLAQAHHRANARDVIVQDVVVFPPRSGAREHRRIVEFANPVEAHVADMLVHKVHPQHHLPVGEALHILKGSLPARASICFAQYPLAAELVRDAAHLLDRTDIAELGMHILLVELIEQHVDTGGLLPRGHRHVVRSLRSRWASCVPNNVPSTKCPFRRNNATTVWPSGRRTYR